MILATPHNLLQVIYDESEEQLEAIAFDEINGKIAVCASQQIRIYKPYGHGSNNEDILKVGKNIDKDENLEADRV